MRYMMLFLCWVGIAGFLGCSAHLPSEPASEPISRPNSWPQVLACTPQRPIVGIDEKVELRVWLEEDRSPKLVYHWQAQAGHITPQGPRALWDLSGVGSGVYRSDVRVQASEEMQKACSVTVVVASKVRTVSGRSFLVRTQQEGENYGLYSYLLLGSKATDETVRKRHLEVIKAYLSWDTTSDLEKIFPHRELNITYLPLKTQPRELVSAESILENYDYPRAKLLLNALPGNHLDGPYLVSSLVPLTNTIQLAGRYLFQDLSWVPADSDLLGLWTKEFLILTSQERFWKEATAREMVLKMRTLIRVVAHGIPEIKAAVDQWIRWISER